METKTDPINLIDWWKAINYLPIGSKLTSLIKSRGISEKDSKLLGVTDQDIYFAKKRVYLKEGRYNDYFELQGRIEDEFLSIDEDVKNYDYATVL